MGYTIAITLTVMLVSVLAVYYYGTHMKKKLDEPVKPLDVGAPLVVALSPAAAQTLGELSSEPIFLKQGLDGLRVQFDNRPLVPLSFLTDTTTTGALLELTSLCLPRFGSQWSALATITPDGASVQRLS